MLKHIIKYLISLSIFASSPIALAADCNQNLSEKYVDLGSIVERVFKLNELLDNDKAVSQERLQFIKSLSSKPIKSYFLNLKERYHSISGEIVRHSSLTETELTNLSIDVLELLQQTKKLLSEVKRIRKLTTEELIILNLTSLASKHVKSGPQLFTTSAEQIDFVLGLNPEITVGRITEIVMMDFVMNHVAQLDNDSLAKGKVKYIRFHPRIEWLKDLFADRFVKKSAGTLISLLWIGPIFLYIKYKESIDAAIASLF